MNTQVNATLPIPAKELTQGEGGQTQLRTRSRVASAKVLGPRPYGSSPRRHVHWSGCRSFWEMNVNVRDTEGEVLSWKRRRERHHGDRHHVSPSRGRLLSLPRCSHSCLLDPSSVSQLDINESQDRFPWSGFSPNIVSVSLCEAAKLLSEGRTVCMNHG